MRTITATTVLVALLAVVTNTHGKHPGKHDAASATDNETDGVDTAMDTTTINDIDDMDSTPTATAE
jgi:hypothetical protein